MPARFVIPRVPMSDQQKKAIGEMVEAIYAQYQGDLEYFTKDKAERRYWRALDALALLIDGLNWNIELLARDRPVEVRGVS